MGGEALVSRARVSGDQGEALAARRLRERGYVILDRQWRCRFGELDIVCRSPEGVLCFVEVKRRREGSAGLPREAVTPAKQNRLRLTAQAYLADRCLDDVPARFDVAEVYEGKGGVFRVVYLENAFE